MRQPNKQIYNLLFYLADNCVVMGGCLGGCVQCATTTHDRYMSWKRRDEDYTDIQIGISPPARNTTLHGAVIDRNITEITRLCKEYPEKVNDLNSSGETALHLACKLGYVPLVHELLNQNCNPGIVTSIGTPLHCVIQAVKAKYLTESDATDLLQLLTQKGCLVDSWSTNGQKTALFCASELGNVRLIKTLLKLGASPDITEDNLFTPFYMSCLRGDLECVHAFIQLCKPLDINHKDTQGRTALLTSLISISANLQEENFKHLEQVMLNRYIRLGIIEELLYAGANPNILDDRNRSPLILAFSLIEQETAQNVMMKRIGMHSAVFTNQGFIAAEASNSTKTQILPFLRLAKEKSYKESMFTPVIRLLLMHGAKCPNRWTKELLHFYDDSPVWLQELYKEALDIQTMISSELPYKLVHLCRVTIRRCLTMNYKLHLLGTLPVPTNMRAFLHFHCV